MVAPTRQAPGPGLTRIAVEGYKCLRTRQEIELRPLTITAGINSSGKSSIMQPLLLLKQTTEASFDPGPLLLHGPNVSIANVEDALSRTSNRNERAKSFTVAIWIGRFETSLTFGKDEHNDLRILEMSGWFTSDQDRRLVLHEGMTEGQIRKTLPRAWLRFPAFGKEAERFGVRVVRQRSLLALAAVAEDQTETASQSVFSFSFTGVEREISRIIHLPALRANPSRTYRTTAVEERYPGTFDTYTAGVIASWQNTGLRDKLAQLRSDLEQLGLTWKVEARQLDDTQVELLVGRLPRAQRGGAWDVVNIADVGFGVSQTLPVIVGLNVAAPGQLVYLEQPEIHLHPRAQCNFAQIIARAVQRGVRVVVETHSAMLIRAVQTLVAEGTMKAEDVALHWFSRDPNTGDTRITSGELDAEGAFGDWPEDFDEVFLESESRYLDAASRKRSR